ncbi:MAG: FAD-binding protein [Candidatus Marinimicrobia bacterium]|nr:FAD-binding protein [Candidatus Neomarinimicrobiota bacterium]
MEKWQVELKKSLGSRVQFDPLDLQLYSTAACLYEMTPLAVVVPENTTDISNTLKICNQYGVSILPRGAATSLSGGTVNRAVVLDISKHFKRIDPIRNESVNVECGVVLDDLQRTLLPYSKKIGPDPSSGNICTLGGMLANNSAGPHSLKHGNLNRHVNSVKMVLANGEAFQAQNVLLNEIESLAEHERTYYNSIRNILKKYQSEIESSRLNVTKNASGYQVWDVLTDTHLNLAKLFAGSEGTLGVFIETNLDVVDKIPFRGVISLYFKDLVKMGVAVQEIRKLGASSIEFVDSSFLKLATDYKPEMKKHLPEKVEYLLYVEFEDSQSIVSLKKKFETLITVIGQKALGQIGDLALNEADILDLYKIRKAASAILNRVEGSDKPLAFIEDAAVHPDVFPQFLEQSKAILDKANVDYVMFGHAGDGNLHIRPMLNLKDEAKLARAVQLMEDFTDLVIKLGGTLSGEHGDGRLRTPLLKDLYPELVPLFKAIKSVFDPQNILNPGIIIPQEDQSWNHHFRYAPDMDFALTNSILDTPQWMDEIQKCHGCGTCRTYCPVFLSSGDEATTGRAKANILRGFLKDNLDHSLWKDQAVLNLMDLCLNCGQCLTDCPTGVDIPGLVVGAKSKLHQHQPYTVEEKMLQNGKLLDQLGHFFRPFSNWLINNSLFRNLLSKTLGVHPQRTLPAFAAKLHFHTKNLVTDVEKQVVLWSGCAAIYNDPDGELLHSEQMLRKLGFTVIHPVWRCCNIAKLSYGNLGALAGDLNENMRILLPYAEQGIPIIFSSASCGYAFMHEYEKFFPERMDVKQVAAVSRDIHEFIGQELASGECEGVFQPLELKVSYHEPCHLKSQKNAYSPKQLFKHIPQLEVLEIRDACCGIAGTYGMKNKNFTRSLEIGEPLFNELKKAQPQLVASGCGTCQIQIEQGTGLATIHPMVLLNKSYKKA